MMNMIFPSPFVSFSAFYYFAYGGMGAELFNSNFRVGIFDPIWVFSFHQIWTGGSRYFDRLITHCNNEGKVEKSILALVIFVTRKMAVSFPH